MNSRRARIGIFALIVPVILCVAPATAQNPPRIISQFAQVSGAVNAPSASGGLEDRSYTATTTGESLELFRQNRHPDLLVPDQAITVDFGFRTFRYGQPVYVSSLTYSNNPASLDVTAQYFAGSFSGYGVAARVDLAGGRQRFVRKLEQTQNQLRLVRLKERKLRQLLNPTQEQLEEAKKQLQEATQAFGMDLEGTAQDLVAASRRTRIAAFLGDRRINDLGNLFNAGISTSQLLRFAANSRDEAPGLTPLASIDAVAYDPTANTLVSPASIYSRSTSFLRSRLGLTFQNRTLYYDKNNNEKPLQGIWSYQLGAEYDFRTALDKADTLGLFVRWRKNEHLQVAAVGGFRSDHQDFIGLNLSFCWGVDSKTRYK